MEAAALEQLRTRGGGGGGHTPVGGMECAKFEQDQSGLVGMFVEKTKAQNDAAGVAAVIAEAVGHEKLFVFGELLELEPVRALEGDAAHGAAFSLLKLFFGCAQPKPPPQQPDSVSTISDGLLPRE